MGRCYSGLNQIIDYLLPRNCTRRLRHKLVCESKEGNLVWLMRLTAVSDDDLSRIDPLDMLEDGYALFRWIKRRA